MGMDARTTAVRPALPGRPREALLPVAVAVQLVLALVLAGCRVDPNIQLMEQELRLQDQRIFELEEHLSDCHEVVASQRRDNESLQRRLDASPRTNLGGTQAPAADTRERPETVDGITVPQVDEGDDVQIAPPTQPLELAPAIEEGATSPPGRGEPTPATGRPLDPADEPSGGGDSAPQPTRSQSSPPAMEMLPPPSFTGKPEEIRQLGLRLAVRYHAKENLPVQVEALVEPQDARLKQVLAAGDVSLMIVPADEATQQQLGRSELARWEFSKDDAKLLWSKSSLGTGLTFELPWPGSPQPGEYRLWVRLVGEDGRKHLGSVDFDVSATQLARRPPPREPLEDASQDGPRLVRSEAEGARAAQEQPRAKERESAPPAADAAPEVAWRKSTEAAQLPRPYAAPTSTAADARRQTGPVDADPQDSWSPNRPSAAADSGAVASSPEHEWSPYR
jgi:hypothetical protein